MAHTYLDSRLPVETRVEALLAEMTLEEKVAQLGSVLPQDVLENGEFSEAKAEKVLKHGIGQISRMAGFGRLEPAEAAKAMNALQSYLREKTRLGIPALNHEECLSGFMGKHGLTVPQAIGLASTWNPDLVKEITEVVAGQLRAVGAHHGLSPVLDVARDLRWGRTEETFGEDPYLVAAMGTAYIRGLQGDASSPKVIATAKHFVAHSAPEGGRNHAPVNVSPRVLREVFCFPFEAAVKEAAVGSVMNAYHDIDGVPCTSSKELLTDLLRGEWGFDGIVVSDYGSIPMLYADHRVATSMQEAGILALEAGLDLELPTTECAVTKDTDGDGKVDQWAAYFGPVTGGHNGERIAHTGIFTHNIPYRLRGHNVWTATFVDIKTGDLFLDEEAFLKGWRLIREMIDEGLIPRQSVGVAMDESREAFIHGMTAYSFDGPDLLNLVYERNNRIERGLEQGEPFEPVVVPRPRFAGSDWVDFPITVIAHGFYSFKQEPYKGDQHTENVFKFAKFLTDPVFQVTLAHRQSIPPDMRVYYGEHAWFPGILGNDRNAQFIEEIPQYWKPQMGIYIQMAITDELSQALQKYEMEIVRPTREAVFLGNMTPEEGVAKLREELDKIDKAIPKERRLSPDAPAIAKDFDDFAKSIGQKY